MILSIEESIDNKATLHMKDISDYSQDGEYYNNSIALFIVKKLSTSKVIGYNFDNLAEYTNIEDGGYRIIFLRIPNKEYYESHKNGETIGIYYNEDKLYKVVEDVIEEISIDFISSVNLESTNLFHTYQDDCSIAQLINCYIKFGKNSIDKIDKCGGNLVKNFNRDFIWITLNIVKYLVDFGQYLDADKILTLIHGCNGICKSGNRESDSIQCGCSSI